MLKTNYIHWLKHVEHAETKDTNFYEMTFRTRNFHSSFARDVFNKNFVGFMCLWCNEKGRTFYSADAARKHMIDKGHCRMLHEGEALAEYVEFYDYSLSYPDAENHSNPDEEVALSELDNTDYQLVLPSGISVGHRSLMRYYKQSVNHNLALVSKPSKLHKVLSCYRALGWTETQQEAATKKARDIHYLKRMQAKFNLALGVKGNKLQKHARAQVNF